MGLCALLADGGVFPIAGILVGGLIGAYVSRDTANYQFGKLIALGCSLAGFGVATYMGMAVWGLCGAPS